MSYTKNDILDLVSGKALSTQLKILERLLKEVGGKPLTESVKKNFLEGKQATANTILKKIMDAEPPKKPEAKKPEAKKPEAKKPKKAEPKNLGKLEPIAGIANLRPVFDFLDKDDARELALVNKAMNKAVSANKEVFKDPPYPDIPYREIMLSFGYMGETIDDFDDSDIFTKKELAVIKKELDYDGVFRIVEAQKPYNFLLLEADNSGDVVFLYGGDVDRFYRKFYPQNYSELYAMDEDEETITERQMKPRKLFDEIKRNSLYKDTTIGSSLEKLMSLIYDPEDVDLDAVD
jgi:hypothetical protein